MKIKNILQVCLYLCSIQFLFSQELKEIKSFHKDGSPKDIVFKNDKIQIVKTQELDINGKLISEYLYNPISEKRNGNFFNTVNRGVYNEGVLNCKDCTISFGLYRKSGIQLKGDYINGRPMGKIKVFYVQENVNKQHDPFMSYILSMEMGQRINYSTYAGTGLFKTTYIMDLNYNVDGFLDGESQINQFTKVYFKNGNIEGLITTEKENQNIVKDSVFDKNKIWKINGEYQQNFGLPIFKYNEFSDPQKIKFDILGIVKNYINGEIFINDDDKYLKHNPLNNRGQQLWIKGKNKYFDYTIFIKNKKTVLNSEGIYDKVLKNNRVSNNEGDWDIIFSKISLQLWDLYTGIIHGQPYNYKTFKEQIGYMYYEEKQEQVFLELKNKLQSNYHLVLKGYYLQDDGYTIELPDGVRYDDGPRPKLISIKNVLKLYEDGLRNNNTSTTKIYFWDKIQNDYVLFDIEVLKKELERLNELDKNEKDDLHFKAKNDKATIEEIEYYLTEINNNFKRDFCGKLEFCGNVEKMPESIRMKMTEKGGVDEYYSEFKANGITKGIGFNLLNGNSVNRQGQFKRDISFIKFYEEVIGNFHKKNYGNSIDKIFNSKFSQFFKNHPEFRTYFIDYIKFNKIELVLNEDKDDYNEIVLHGTIFSKPIKPDRFRGSPEPIYKVLKKLYKNGYNGFKIVYNLQDLKGYLIDEKSGLLLTF